jgi:cytochrome c biogenesis protein CcmG/thiol:disulfide interchange protein DsbE
LLVALLAAVGWKMARAQSGPIGQGVAPDFSLDSFGGETLVMSELRGKVVVINFWASWCPPCREEAAYLEQTWRDYRDQGVVFIGVNYVDTQAEALAYLEEFDITYFNGPDLGTRISQLYNLQGVPETFFISKGGEIRGVKIGPLYPPELTNWIDELLAEDDEMDLAE